MKKIKAILQNKQGSSSLIYSVAILIFLCVLTLAVIVTLQFRNLSLELYRTANASLEEYIVVQARNNIDSIKNGHNYLPYIDEDEFVEYLANAIGVDENLQGKTANGRSFEISNLELAFDVSNKMDTKVQFDLTMPVIVSGITFPPFETTVVIHSELESKF